MNIANLPFYAFAAMACVGAFTAIRMERVVYAVCGALIFFTAIAGLFILLFAEFIAVAQVLLYVGAVGVLFLFVIMLTPQLGNRAERIDSRGSIWGLVASVGILFGILLPAITQAILPGEPVDKISPSVLKLGLVLMTHTPALEMIGLLLTAALIGAVVIAMDE